MRWDESGSTEIEQACDNAAKGLLKSQVEVEMKVYNASNRGNKLFEEMQNRSILERGYRRSWYAQEQRNF